MFTLINPHRRSDVGAGNDVTSKTPADSLCVKEAQQRIYNTVGMID